MECRLKGNKEEKLKKQTDGYYSIPGTPPFIHHLVPLHILVWNGVVSVDIKAKFYK
jgi:hypothetical protein